MKTERGPGDPHLPPKNFGTFLTRSGLVNSVHAFADSNLGRFFLYYMAFVLAGALLLVADRQSFLASKRRLDSMLSREAPSCSTTSCW